MKLSTALFLLFTTVSTSAYAAHGLALGQQVLHPAGFQSFNYVNPNAPKGGMFTLPLPGGFDTLNPFTLKGDHEAGVGTLTLDTLTAKGQDEPFAMYGLIAEDMELAPDGLSVTFKINPKARFQNGDPVLAEDVAASFNTLTQDKAASPQYRFYWADVDRVETPSKRTVVFRFKKPNAELHMILGQLPVFSHKSYPKGLAAGANAMPIGSGPYRLSKAENGRLSEFQRDKNYWAQNLPTRKGMYNFDTVRFKYYKDDTVRIEGLKSGNYDFMQENTARHWARSYTDKILDKNNLSKHDWTQQSTAGMQGFVMNLRRKPFDDIRVRQALMLSFDFESLNNRLFYGLYTRSNSFFTNSEMAATGKPEGRELAILNTARSNLPAAVFTQNVPEPPKTDSVLGIRPNLLKARALLEQAGYRYQNGVLIDKQGTPLAIEYLTYSKTFERVVTKWQRDLAKIGIRLNIRLADPAIYQQRLNRFDFDITTVVYGNSESPGNEQFSYFSCTAAKTNGSQNWAGVCDPAIETLLKRFENFRSRDELVAVARALDRTLRHQYIIIPNWYTNRYRVVYRNTLGIPVKQPKYYSATDWVLSTAWQK